MTSSHKSTVLSVVAVIVSLNVLDLPPPGSAADQPPAITVKPPSIPNPIAEFTGSENYQTNGQSWTRYKLAVKNYQAYPAAMFAPAPNLPPCGSNKNSARTWTEIYTINQKVSLPQTQPQYVYVYGFCAFSSPQDLLNLWFAVPQGQHPPTPVYVILNDRQLNKKYVSNPINIPAPAPTKPGGVQ